MYIILCIYIYIPQGHVCSYGINIVTLKKLYCHDFDLKLVFMIFILTYFHENNLILIFNHCFDDFSQH